MTITPRPNEADVHALLAACGLPTVDLTPGHLAHFFGCGEPGSLRGVVGIEPLGEVALLRSLAVTAAARNTGCGQRLVETAENHARNTGARHVFLLTTTAQKFFERLGYVVADRDTAPDAIRKTSEFATVCAATAVLMRKVI